MKREAFGRFDVHLDLYMQHVLEPLLELKLEEYGK